MQQVINAVGPAVVDFDIENTDEFENYTVQDRILNGLKIVKQNNPNVKVAVTFGTSTTGPNAHGVRLINQARALTVPIDNFTIMPFDFGGANIYNDTVNAAEGLKNALKNAYGWSDAQAYAHMGISGMNGLSDQQELTTPQTWTQILNWAQVQGPDQARLLGRQPRPPLPRRRRDLQLQRHRPEQLGVHQDHRRLLTGAGPGAVRGRPGLTACGRAGWVSAGSRPPAAGRPAVPRRTRASRHGRSAAASAARPARRPRRPARPARW